MLNLIICIFAAVSLFLCTFSFIRQVTSALRFRNKIAVPQCYTEGIMTGLSYPLLIISVSLMFVQFVLFIAFPIKTEFFAVLRFAAYLVTLLIFIFSRSLSPSLLAYWFGKDHIYENGDPQKAFTYDNITSIYSTPRKVPTNQNCRVTFTVAGKFFFGRKRKFICRMTGKDFKKILGKYSARYSGDIAASENSRAAFPSFAVPVLYLLIAFSVLLIISGTGIFSPYLYSGSEDFFSEEVDTLSPISDIAVDEKSDRIFVLYGNVGIINAYDLEGNYVYSLSVPVTPFCKRSINLSDNTVFPDVDLASVFSYRYGKYGGYFDPITGDRLGDIAPNVQFVKNGAYISGDKTFSFDRHNVYSVSGNKTETVISSPVYTAVFDPIPYWIVICVSVLMVFIFRRIILKESAEYFSVPEESDIIYNEDGFGISSDEDEETEEEPSGEDDTGSDEEEAEENLR